MCSAGSALAQTKNIFDTLHINDNKDIIYINTARDSVWTATVSEYDSTKTKFYPNGLGGGAIIDIKLAKPVNSHAGEYLMPDGNYYSYEMLITLFPSFRYEKVLKQIQNKK